ncbi:DUF6587 family protein [Pseudoxanthomonas dokdonensis]|uniref:Uncharacterized protein n=1 Tax=Pseudoxanthomonas dokdonensis TaxID=344882 RepID=A0A0R0CY04_9GAMM|nr:DUF6587 family protein [Pseudoxanthomonas dokdonensis]KRG70974.1 hypothetical protein ABB29_03845 [Pseudoxanthomonas dokdonensis]
MELSLALQYAVIVLAALASVLVVWKKQFPRSLRRLRSAIALRLLREQAPAWQRRLGRRIAPPAQSIGAAACGGCDSCGPSRPGK